MLRFPYKLVTFDVNGTLLNVAPIGKTYAETAKKHGVRADPQKISEGFRSAYKAMDRKHPNFGLSDLGWQSWWTAVVKETFRSTVEGIDVDARHGKSQDTEIGDHLAVEGGAETKLDAIASDLIQHFSTGKPWLLEDGAFEILHLLKSHQVTLGIISNTDPRLHSILKDHNLSKHFNFILTSYEAGVMKPSVDIFNQASKLYEKHTGCSLIGHQALHIGNSYELDCLAAQKAGWHSVLVLSKGIDSEKCTVFKNLKELNDHLAMLDA